jgi:hypothetical protein
VADTASMSTPVSTPALLRRVAARAGIGVWQSRGGVLLAAAVLIGLLGYVVVTSSGALALSAGPGSGTGSAVSTDCADTVMSAIAAQSASTAQRAYQCMDTSFQQRVPEQVFVQQLQSRAISNVSGVERVGDYHTPAGGTMVYYAMNANGQSAGYIVYVGQNGKILKIE